MTLPRDPGPAKDRNSTPASVLSPRHGSADPAAYGLRPGLEGLRDLMDRLLAPDGCPWDREQTLESLKPYLIEEAYEVLDAMDEPDAHRRELGDLLLQIVFHSAIREREGAFDLDGVITAIREKMIRRHPHVFDPGSTPATDAAAVTRQWTQIKQAERGDTGPQNPLAGVPRTLPALQRAWRLQDKAASVGFDWPDFTGAVAKIREEWEELDRARESGDLDHVREEFGDLLFVLVRYGQKLGLAAEDALRAAAKFEARFAHVMERCHAAGIDPNTAGLAVLDGFWDDAKARGIKPG